MNKAASATLSKLKELHVWPHCRRIIEFTMKRWSKRGRQAVPWCLLGPPLPLAPGWLYPVLCHKRKRPREKVPPFSAAIWSFGSHYRL